MWPSWAELEGPLRVALRLGPLCALAPFFGARRTPAPIRIGLCGGLALAWGPALAPARSSLVDEAMTGGWAALTAILVFKSAESAGRLLDVARGTHHAEVVSPDASGRSSPLGRGADVLSLALFAQLHGPAWSLAGLRRVAAAPPEPAAAWGAAFEAAFAIVLPAMIACLLTDLAFGCVARWATRLQAFVLALGPKSLVALVVLAVAGIEPWQRFAEGLLHLVGAE